VSDLKEQARRVAILAALGERITEAAQQARAELVADMREIGAEKVTAELPDGTAVASVSLAAGSKARAYVADEAAFTKWVAAEHPSELEYTVRPAFRKRVLDGATRPSDGQLAPGVELADSKPYLSNRFKSGGKDAVAEAWRDGSLAELLPGLLAIEGGEES
jgi:hypothetical protein